MKYAPKTAWRSQERRKENPMDEKQAKPRRPLWFWMFVGLGVVVLIFGLGAPRALRSSKAAPSTTP